MAPVYDALVIGSGATGGYAAKALSEAGMRVIVLESGQSRRQSDAVLLYDSLRRRLGYRIEEDPGAVRRQPVQSSCYAWPRHPHAFVDDIDNPYATEPGKPFAWIRSRQVGGRMLVRRHGLQFYRFSDFDFKAGDRDGASANWPISYSDVAPYYDRIERWMRVRGSADGIAHLPDPVLASEVEPNAGERLVKTAIERAWKDRRLIPGRTAAAPAPIQDAVATGRCTLRTNAVVRRLIVDPRSARVTGAAFVDRRTRREREVTAKIVVLCASSIESARLLLASSTRQHPDGLGNSSGMVGRHLMDHVHLTGLYADMPLVEPVRAASWSYIPCFRNVSSAAGSFVRGYGLQVFTMWRECGLIAFGEMLPHPDNRVTLDAARTDAWGVPIARIECVHRNNELAMTRDIVDACRDIFTAARFAVTRVNATLSVPGTAIHEVGTARMGADPRTSVLNQFCQSWDVRNLFVMDGSCFVTQGVQNPTLTMLALTARSCDYLIDAHRRGDL